MPCTFLSTINGFKLRNTGNINSGSQKKNFVIIVFCFYPRIVAVIGLIRALMYGMLLDVGKLGDNCGGIERSLIYVPLMQKYKLFLYTYSYMKM